MGLRILKDAKNRRCRPAQARDLFPVGFEQRNDSPGGMNRLIGSFLHSVEKELQPRFPIPSGSNAGQKIVIDLPMSLEELNRGRSIAHR